MASEVSRNVFFDVDGVFWNGAEFLLVAYIRYTPSTLLHHQKKAFSTTHRILNTRNMSVFFYEPFYDFERLVDEAFLGERGGHQLQTRLGTNPRSVDGAMRAFRPRSALLFFHSIISSKRSNTISRMDLHEDPDRNLVTASFELPGVSREEIDIQVQNNRLTISTETKRSSEHSEDGYAVRERSFGKYSRALQLPQGIKVSLSS